MRISLIDRSRTRTGESDAAAIEATVARAIRADRLGFHRFWTAEHHAVPGIASAAPVVLLAAIGARTRTIRLGTAGIMVPNHRPLVIAEQALLIEALHPGRIDLGLGGSLGFTAPVRRALGRTELDMSDYAAEIGEVLGYLSGEAELTPRPRVAPPAVSLLAIKGGLRLAAELGLPALIGGPLLADANAIAAYFRDFRPSQGQPEPHLTVSVEVSVAESEERARELLLPEAWSFANSRVVGEFRALEPVAESRRKLDAAPSPSIREAAEAYLSAAIAGDPDQVTTALRRVLARTGATEVLASVSTYDREHVAEADELLASLRDGDGSAE